MGVGVKRLLDHKLVQSQVLGKVWEFGFGFGFGLGWVGLGWVERRGLTCD